MQALQMFSSDQSFSKSCVENAGKCCRLAEAQTCSVVAVGMLSGSEEAWV